MNKTSNLNKIKGCLIGLACGDYLGMPVEFFSKDQVIESFGGHKLKPIKCTHRSAQVLPDGYYTDDTAMTICLTETLIKNEYILNLAEQLYQKQK